MRRIITYQWVRLAIKTEHPPMLCEKGDRVRFTWESNFHSVSTMGSE